MEVTCPHCGKAIDLVGAREIEADFGLSSNTVQHARTLGKFPPAWLEVNNRKLYLRDVVAQYAQDRSARKAGTAADELAEAFDALPEEERRAILDRLAKRV